MNVEVTRLYEDLDPVCPRCRWVAFEFPFRRDPSGERMTADPVRPDDAPFAECDCGGEAKIDLALEERRRAALSPDERTWLRSYARFKNELVSTLRSEGAVDTPIGRFRFVASSARSGRNPVRPGEIPVASRQQLALKVPADWLKRLVSEPDKAARMLSAINANDPATIPMSAASSEAVDPARELAARLQRDSDASPGSLERIECRGLDEAILRTLQTRGATVIRGIGRLRVTTGQTSIDSTQLLFFTPAGELLDLIEELNAGE